MKTSKIRRIACRLLAAGKRQISVVCDLHFRLRLDNMGLSDSG